MMNQFCKTFFKVYFAATAVAMALLSYGFVHSLMGLM